MADKREHIERTIGRRQDDRECALCQYLRDSNKTEHSGFCKKIESASERAGKAEEAAIKRTDDLEKSKTGKAEFYWVMGIFLTIMLSAFGMIGNHLSGGIKDVKSDVNLVFTALKNEHDEDTKVVHNRISKAAEERAEALKAIGQALNETNKTLNETNRRLDSVELQLRIGFEKGAKADKPNPR